MLRSEQDRFPVARERARSYPIGAELVTANRANIRVWVTSSASLDLWLDGQTRPMLPEDNGYFSATVDAHAGSRYAFRFPGDERLYPDPASKYQPEGPEAPSAIVDLAAYQWNDAQWRGIDLRDQVFSEIHIGTFTAGGTWRSAEAELPRLRDTGITVIQMMPIAEFAGAFGWGYDGVQWFAPTRNYGTPADLQQFVDIAHQHGLGVILDVVYNHLGPSGNFLPRFSPQYFTDAYVNEWGQALNFDGEGSACMRELVLSNVEYWIREFHVDGFRLDAAQQIYDKSPEHVLAALSRTARAAAARPIVILAEHEPQHARLMRAPEQNGFGLDGIYNEDFHHSMRVTLTGSREAYLSDYAGTSEEWLAAAQAGFLFQGQYYPWQSAPRGAPALDIPLVHFICFLENHDQVANSPTTQRLLDLTHPAWWRSASALLLLGPWTPLLFQGQESGSSRPFRYFCDHNSELQSAVLDGRRQFLSQFGRMASDLTQALSLEDLGERSFIACRLPAGSDSRRELVSRLYRDLLALRRTDPTLGPHASQVMGATLGDRTMLLRYRGDSDAGDRLVVFNLGPDRNIAAEPQPLIAPPARHEWSLLWCSEDRQYGGSGVSPSRPPQKLIATGHATSVFIPRPVAL